MHKTLEFLLHHGYVVLLVWVFAEQIGMPVPSLPLMLAAGALAGTGHLSFFFSLFVCVCAALAADSIWYFGFLFAPALTIGGGTAQVQRNIIAERTLGLPHDPPVDAQVSSGPASE